MVLDMFRRGKIIYLAGVMAAMALAVTVALLFLPGFDGAAPPPETVGEDVVVAGAGFLNGDMDGTGVVNAGSGDVLTLKPSRSSGAFTSEAVETQYPFNALGLHWSASNPQGSQVSAEVRFSGDGSAWSEWRPVLVSEEEFPDHIGQTKSAGETIGDLVFAEAPARYFQYRLNLVPGSTGEAPSIDRLVASYIDGRGYHESPLSLAGLWDKAAAFVKPEKVDAQPGIVTRAQWGANPAYMTWDPSYAAPRKQIVHHTVTSNYDPDPAGTVRSIYYYHAVSLGWGDIGYNFLVDRNGNIYEGRYGGNGVIGGHAYGWNAGTIGISALGNYEESGITSQMYIGFVELMAWKSNENMIDPWGIEPYNGVYSHNYLGHRDTYSTACPGSYLYVYLNNFRTDAYARYSPIPIIGGIRGKYDALGHAPGMPRNAEYPIYDASDQWIGQAQDFQYGRLIWNKDTTEVFWVLGAILGKYDALGREKSFLGMPASDEFGAGGGRGNSFAGGHIYWGSTTNARVVYGAILGKLQSLGGVNAVGLPTTDEYDVAGFSGARESDFQRGRIYWTFENGARSVYGAILGKYLQMGGPGSFGMPSGDEGDITGRPGGRQQAFTSGNIYWSFETSARTISGVINDKYTEMGGPAGALGLPSSDEYAASGGGRAQNLEKAIITTSSQTGTHVVFGGIMLKYRQLGGATGDLGLATTDEIDAAGVTGGRESDFQNGRIYWTFATDARGVYGAILNKYLEAGGSAAFGIPTTDEFSIPGVTGGRESDFQSGRVYWSPATGAAIVYGSILGKYLEYGGPSVGLGMPLADETDATGVTGARMSRFAYGRIYWSATTGPHAVYGSILGKYLEYGGSGSSLGVPTSDEYAYGAGRRSDFQGGYIYWTAATGAQVFVGATATVTASSSFEVRDGNGSLLTTLNAGQVATVSYTGSSYFVRGDNGYSGTSASHIRMSPTSASGIMQVTSYHDVPTWNTSLDDNTFRGTIEMRYSAVSNAVWVVNELPLEMYLRGVAETSSGSPADLLKALTVAARDYALYHVNNGGKYYNGQQDIFHLKNSRNGNGDDQQYKGYGLESRFPDLTTAVDATTGEVVTYNGSLAVTTYFSNSDGRTRSAQEAWGTSSWPWLASVLDPDCNGMTLSGHGVGMSGYGALKRAERGDSYQAILTYYYTGTQVGVMDTNKNIRVAITPVS